MHSIERSYTINKIFLKLLGIWPHDRSRLVFLQRILIITIAVTFIILQLAVFITMKYNLVLFVNTMSLALTSIIITMKYCIFIFKSKAIKILHYHIQEDWKIMRNKLENDIIKKHIHECQFFTIFIFWSICLLLVVANIIQLFPVILDFILPLDVPRPRKCLIVLEYFVSQDKYFFTRIFHIFVLDILCGSMMFATSTQLILFVYHSFGMFQIASHRIKHSIDDYDLHMPNHEKERIFCKKIIQVVIAHRRAIEFSNTLLSSFSVPYCVIAILGVFSLSVNLFKFVHAATVLKKTDDMLIALFTILGHLVYMFGANYIGQRVTDYNNEIFRLIYGTSWYLMPVTSQKLILFLLARTGKDYYFTVGFLFVAKVENFAMLVNTALSYVAVMYSIQ